MSINLKQYVFSELRTGMNATISKKITEKDIKKFSINTGDSNPLHSDSTYCKKEGFKGLLAHGMLLSSYASTIIGMCLPGENAIILSVNFTFIKPAFAGDDIVIHGQIDKIDARFKTVDVKIKIKRNNVLINSGLVKVKLRK